MPIVDFATGFECRATAHILNGFCNHTPGGSTGPGVIVTSNMRSGQRCWSHSDTFGSNCGKFFLTPRATRVVAAGWRPASFHGSPVFALKDELNTQLGVFFRTDGKFEIWRSDGNVFPQKTALLATSSDANRVTAFNVYHHLEMVATIHPSAGAVQLYLNNDPIPIINVSGVNTRATANSTSNGIYWAGGGGDIYDDIYTSDSRLTFPDQKILGVNASVGNGTLVGSTPKTGTDRGAMVGEVTSDDDTSYNIFDPTEADSYLHPPFGTTSLINFVSVWGRMKKTNYGPVGTKVGLLVGGAPQVGAEYYLPVGYVNFGQFFNVNPVTGNPFTENELNAAQFYSIRSA